MKASDLFVKCMEAEGVKYIFGLPGEENIDLVDSISKSDIKFIVTRHEQGAAFMADVYGRITGNPGVCLSTLGPGATNLLTGVANAHLDKVPLLAITAQAQTTRLHKESHQNVDTIKLFSGITKYNQPVMDASTIPEIIRKGVHLTTHTTPGAVHIQLPENIAKEETTGEPLPHLYQFPVEPEKQTYEAVAAEIMKAENPIVLAGNGVIRSRAWKELKAFIDQTNIPMVNTFMSKGILPFDHPRNLFSVGGVPYPVGLRPLHAADLVIAVGFDLVEYDPINWNADRKRKIINIHTVSLETDEHFPIELDVVGNLKLILNSLSAHIKRREDTSVHDQIRERRLKELTTVPNKFEELPRKVMWHLNEAMPENAFLISDVGLHKVWVSRWYQPKSPGKTIVFNGFASMGGSVPGAIACKLAKPEDPVVVVAGDGGFLMNVQELETARRIGTNFTAIVFNDGRYSLIAEHQMMSGLPVSNVFFSNPDLSLLAKSFGMSYFRAESEDDFKKAFEASVNSDSMNLIEVVHNEEMKV
ncbi:hypothetical protein IX51_05520 [uncultured archaeon]|nr:hypothetical protein IX51_05520 [uncultured archaeon]HKJ96239.1 acetolactate synthase large subunit [Thermoplasmataceae archaeon]